MARPRKRPTKVLATRMAADRARLVHAACTLLNVPESRFIGAAAITIACESLRRATAPTVTSRTNVAENDS